MIRKLEIKAFTLDEAKEKAKQQGMFVLKNITSSWNKMGKPISNFEFKLFAIEMLDKYKIRDAEGVGLLVAIIPGNSEKKIRPYKIHNSFFPGKKGKKRFFEIRCAEDGRLLAETSTKNEAVRKSKQLITELKKDIVCKIVWRPAIPEQEIAFKLDYVPASKSKEGTYFVFGSTKEDDNF